MKHSNIAIFVPHMGCPNQCSFCNQHTISAIESPPTLQQVAVLLTEACSKLRAPQQAEIAFFGGSFTAIEPGYMQSLLEVAASFVAQYALKGIRISTRPDFIDDDILALLKRYRVSAIELGVQSLNDQVLAKNRRGHTADIAIAAAKKIKAHGFSLGLQMMTGLYGDTQQTLKQTTQTILDLAPDTVRIYPTVVLKGTYLETLYRQGLYTPPDVDESVELCATLLQQFERANIRVIRLGLHASKQIEQNFVAGAYHPAFRELCENKLYFDLTIQALESIPKGKVLIKVDPKHISKFCGQKRQNIIRLAQMGYEIKLIPTQGLGNYTIVAHPALSRMEPSKKERNTCF